MLTDVVLLPLAQVKRALRVAWVKGFGWGAFAGYVAGVLYTQRYYREQWNGTFSAPFDVRPDCGDPACPKCAPGRPN